MNDNITLPSDENAERNILGTLINHDELFTQVEDIIDSDMFYSTPNRAMAKILCRLLKQKVVIDEGSVVAEARKQGNTIGINIDDVRYALAELSTFDSPYTLAQDMARVAEYSIRRKLWEAMQRAATKSVILTDDIEGTMDHAVRQIEMLRTSTVPDDGVVDATQALRMVNETVNDNLAGVNKQTVKTGFRFCDAKGGFRQGSLVVIGAFTSVGKSTLAMNMAVNAAKNGTPVAYYSLEMSVVELWSRILNEHTGVSAGKILGYPLRRDEIAAIGGSTDELMKLPLYIDDKATTSFSRMIRSVRMMKKRHGIKIFVVDYLQIFAQNMRGEREETALSNMARELKNICRELDVVCILLSQLRRPGEEKHPTIDMLRGSGQIEESADNIILIDRPDAHPEWNVTSFRYDKNVPVKDHAEMRVCKGRNIGLGTWYVVFDPTRFVFYEEDGYRIGDTIGYDGEPAYVEPVQEPLNRKEEYQNLPF